MHSPAYIVGTSKISGKGVFAAEPIESGAVVFYWNPKVLNKKEASLLPISEQQNYLQAEGDNFLWMQPPERFVNHSCDPNTIAQGRSDVAIRDILPGEEITSDYLDFTDAKSTCHCGSALCRNPAP